MDGVWDESRITQDWKVKQTMAFESGSSHVGYAWKEISESTTSLEIASQLASLCITPKNAESIMNNAAPTWEHPSSRSLMLIPSAYGDFHL
jgi:hypothetical protein